MKFFLALSLFYFSSAEARVFSIKESGFATYFKGSYGVSALNKDAYEKTSGTQTGFVEEANYNWGGEIGFVFPTPSYALRVGLEAISPSLPSGIKGYNTANNAEIMTLDSKINAFFPVVHLEIFVNNDANGRVYVAVGGGYGKVSLTNEYTFNAAGDALYTPLTSFSEKASQTTTLFETAVGYELSFVQSTTVSFELGYRYLKADDLEYDNAGTNFIGPHAAGAPVLNSDGSKKSLDLGGVFTGLSFRFYFN